MKLAWKRVEHNIPVTAVVMEEKSPNGVSSILEITETVGFYSGQYYCIAENEIGPVVSQIANLYVQGRNMYHLLQLHACIIYLSIVTYPILEIRKYFGNM